MKVRGKGEGERERVKVAVLDRCGRLTEIAGREKDENQNGKRERMTEREECEARKENAETPPSLIERE